MADFRSVCETIQDKSQGNSYIWSTLLFHPDYWEGLVNHQLITSEELSRVRDLKWSALMKVPLNLVDIADFDLSEDYPYNAAGIQVGRLLDMAIGVHNEGRLRDSNFLAEFILYPMDSGVTAEQIERLLVKLQNPSNLPDAWAMILITTCILTKGVNKKRVAQLWREIDGSSRLHLWFVGAHSPSRVSLTMEWLKDLMDIGDLASLDLAISFHSLIRDMPHNFSQKLNQALAAFLLKSPTLAKEQVVLASGLLNTIATLSEAALYADPVWFESAIPNVPHFPARVGEKIRLMPQAVPRLEYPRLFDCLKPLLDRSRGYPVEVSAAALNALIQIDMAAREPVKEELWRVSDQDSV
jgi:hypothetical protein